MYPNADCSSTEYIPYSQDFGYNIEYKVRGLETGLNCCEVTNVDDDDDDDDDGCGGGGGGGDDDDDNNNNNNT